MATELIPSPYDQALELALRIEDLLARARLAPSGVADGGRLAHALTGNLIDQLESLRAVRAA
jgi:hypothetical protein